MGIEINIKKFFDYNFYYLIFKTGYVNKIYLLKS